MTDQEQPELPGMNPSGHSSRHRCICGEVSTHLCDGCDARGRPVREVDTIDHCELCVARGLGPLEMTPRRYEWVRDA